MTGPSPRPLMVPPPADGSRQYERTILVVDDHVTFAEALASVLDARAGLRALAATTSEAARRALAEHKVDLVLLEVGLGGGEGIQFARQARTRDSGLRIIAVTVGEDEHQVADAVRAGVCGWVPKWEPVDHLVSVVHGVLRGETRIPAQLLTGVLADLTSARRDAASQDQLLATLTRREKEILDLLIAGMKTADIARRLCLSINTVRTHIRNILKKLNVHSMLAAVALARRAETAL
jgi:DNA-binding NarL/FixJ family response regulator